MTKPRDPGQICPDKLYPIASVTSITGWQSAALRSARQAGLIVREGRGKRNHGIRTRKRGSRNGTTV